MSKRTLNKNLIREWMEINGKGSLEKLALAAGCTSSFMQKLVSPSYAGIPKLDIIDGMTRLTGYTLDELFPCEDEESA